MASSYRQDPYWVTFFTCPTTEGEPAEGIVEAFEDVYTHFDAQSRAALANLINALVENLDECHRRNFDRVHHAVVEQHTDDNTKPSRALVMFCLMRSAMIQQVLWLRCAVRDIDGPTFCQNARRIFDCLAPVGVRDYESMVQETEEAVQQPAPTLKCLYAGIESVTRLCIQSLREDVRDYLEDPVWAPGT